MKSLAFVAAASAVVAHGVSAQSSPTAAPALSSTSVYAETGEERVGIDSMEAFRRARDAAVGARGSMQRARVRAELRQRIEAGLLDPRRVLLSDVGPMQREVDDPMKLNGFAAAPALIPGASLRDFGLGGNGFDKLGYFDGMETYEKDPDPNDSSFTTGRLSGQSPPPPPLFRGVPDGDPWFLTQFWYTAEATGDVLYVADQDGVKDDPLPMSRNPFNPGSTGGYPLDRDPMVEQVMMIGRGNTNPPVVQAGYFNGANTSHRLYVPDPLSDETTPGAMLVAVDFFFQDYETFSWHDGISNIEGFINARWFQCGYDFSDSFGPFTEVNGQLQRPVVLGTLPGNFSIGQFFATPVNPAPGLPTFRTKTGEWFITAWRISGQDMQMWVRDSSTDGSGAFLIDDPRDVEFFENGWAEVY
ncbi:MAG: hypothetical protein VYC34_04670, partial [Planctomycetota bacterium]|nr:hypothetical protein [Planctomycetota bacterium]